MSEIRLLITALNLDYMNPATTSVVVKRQISRIRCLYAFSSFAEFYLIPNKILGIHESESTETIYHVALFTL